MASRWGICKDIHGDYSHGEKMVAINDVILGNKSLNSITKAELVEVIRYLTENGNEETQTEKTNTQIKTQAENGEPQDYWHGAFSQRKRRTRGV